MEGKPQMASVAFHPDGKSLITGHFTGEQNPYSICFWEVPSGRWTKGIANKTSGMRYLSISKDATFGVGTIGTAPLFPFREIQLWDLKKGLGIEELNPAEADGCTTRAAVSPDGKWIVWVAADSTRLVLWQVAAHKPRAVLDYAERQEELGLIHAKFSPDGKQIAVLAHKHVRAKDEEYQVEATIRLIEVVSSPK